MNSALQPISAEDELLRLGAKSWRSQLFGFALMTLVAAWVFNLNGRNAPQLWIWAALLLILFTAQVYLFLQLDRTPATTPVSTAWWCGALVISTNVGIIWGSLPWWLPLSVR